MIVLWFEPSAAFARYAGCVLGALAAWALGIANFLTFVWGFIALAKSKAAVPAVEDLDAPKLTEWPRVSIIVAACNEDARIESAIESLLASDYPNLQVIAVNDRSSDDTGPVLDMLAAQHDRLSVVHNTALPEGWLGKVNALRMGYEQSDGAYVLLADADMHIEPGALQRIVAWTEANAIDHLTAVPSTWRTDVFTEASWTVGHILMVMFTKLWLVADPASSAHVGVGAFNLLRRSAFDETEGFEWFKLDVADDWAVGLLMKSTGHRCAVVLGLEDIHLPWYEGFGGMVRGMEKNMFAILAQYSPWRAMFHVCGVVAVFWVSTALLFTSAWPIALVSMIAMIALAVSICVWLERPPWFGLLAPLGAVLNAFILARGTVLGLRRGGVLWRGTLYPTALMRGEMRVRF